MAEQAILNLQKIKERDEEALRQLFELLLPRLRSISRSYPDADELVQEALFRIYSHLDKAPMDDSPPRFMSWCMAIVRNVARDYARKLRREESQCERFDAEPRVADLLTGRTHSILEKALSQLSKSDRELLESRLSGTPMSAIAELQHESSAVVYRRYTRILSELRKQFQLESEAGI
jgi:RNA polymerase sigma factor (sigma-70 family)